MFTRAEIEEAFGRYQEVAARAAESGDWRAWADQFTEDATYVEHHFGEFHGREAIFRWISETMSVAPNSDMTSFPIDWYVIDEQKGWVVCSVLNRMRDPGDGTVHQQANWTLLKYAGDDRWSYEEDLYNPNEFATMITGWMKTRDALSG
ncbi:MAG TPA: nuclear transport factor 2 family protein [Acidimicrobiales bacterium]